MSHYQLHCEMIVPKPVEEVFEMFENPYNLAIITPPWLNFLVTSKERVAMGMGAVIDYRFRWMGLPMHWRTRITEYAPPRRFVDEALRSPYVYWRHRHTFEAAAGGTVVRDQVDYALPIGPLGRLVHGLAVRRSLIAIFTYRQQALDRHWGGGSRITWPVIRSSESRTGVRETASREGRASSLPL